MPIADERLAVLESTVKDILRELGLARSRIYDLEGDRATLERYDERQKNFGRSLDGLRAEMTAFRADVSGLRRTLLGFAITVAASSVAIAISILISTGRV